MTAFFLAVASFILLMVALGLVRILRGPDTSDRLMAAQLIGSGGVAILLLLAAAMGFAGHHRRGAHAGDSLRSSHP